MTPMVISAADMPPTAPAKKTAEPTARLMLKRLRALGTAKFGPNIRYPTLTTNGNNGGKCVVNPTPDLYRRASNV